MKKFNRLFVTLLCLSFWLPSIGAEIKATASTDSAAILMGKQTTLHIDVVGQLNEKGALSVIDTMWRDV